MISRLIFVAVGLLFAPISYAQMMHLGPAKTIRLAETLPHYDIVSVKQNISGDGHWGISIHEYTLNATNVTLVTLIEFAYDIKEDLVSGLSGQVASAHFDVEAKILPPDSGEPPKPKDLHMAAMMISLLADRFRLKAHLQSRMRPIYELVVEHGGPKVKLSQGEQTGSGLNINWSGNDKTLHASASSLDDLAAALSDEVHRKVIDKTGLSGYADMTLKWTSDEAGETSTQSALSIFTAVQDQLGLKLQPTKGPVDSLVIDHVETPSAN